MKPVISFLIDYILYTQYFWTNNRNVFDYDKP